MEGQPQNEESESNGSMFDNEDVSDEDFATEVGKAQSASDVDDFNLEGQDESDELETTSSDEDDDGMSRAELLKAQNPETIKSLCLEIEEGLTGASNGRKSANDEVKAILSNGEARGLSRDAIKLGHKFLQWDQRKRDGFVTGLQAYLGANGYDLQADLFPINVVTSDDS